MKEEIIELDDLPEEECSSATSAIGIPQISETTSRINPSSLPIRVIKFKCEPISSLESSLPKVKQELPTTRKIFNLDPINLNSDTSSVAIAPSSSPIRRIDKTKFTILTYNIFGLQKRRLFIFIGNGNCYEFDSATTHSSSGCRFVCAECKVYNNPLTAILKCENGERFIEVEDKPHLCESKIYDAKKYFKPTQAIKKPSYELIEKIFKGQPKKVLYIFDSSNRNLCYTYAQQKNEIYSCSGCDSLGFKNNMAKIYNYGAQNEWLGTTAVDKHYCTPHPFDPDAKISSKKYVEAENFCLQTILKAGKEKHTVVVFEKDDRALCRQYHYRAASKLFYCNACQLLGRRVYAKLCQAPNGDDYLTLNTDEHVCEPKEYANLQAIGTLEADRFEIINKKKIFIFLPEDILMGHEFTAYGLARKKEFKCDGCGYTVKLCERPTGEPYLSMELKRHDCQPQVYELVTAGLKEAPSAFPEYEFFCYRQKFKTRTTTSLIVFTDSDRRFCHKFNYKPQDRTFHCLECRRKQAFVMAKIILNDHTGKLSLSFGRTEHVCEPLIYANIEVKHKRRLNVKHYVFTRKKWTVRKKLQEVTESEDEEDKPEEDVDMKRVKTEAESEI